MAVTYNAPERIDDLAFRLSWSSDATTPVPFRVYREGVLIASFDSEDGIGEIALTIGPGESPFVEVLDRDDAVPSLAYPGSLTVHWQAVSGADSYQIEEYIDAAWTLRQTIPDTGEGTFSWQSRWLEDVTTHQFRVTPVDAGGNDGTALSFSVLMVRHPDTPDVTYTYNGAATPTLTIEAA